MKICLVVGHRESSQGASNSLCGITEFEFNNRLAVSIASICKHDCFIIHREDIRSGYNKLPNKINKFDCDLVISLHCNAFNGKAGGHEVLYWNTSTKGKAWAIRINKAIGLALGNNDRGIKPIKQGDRGANVLRSTKAPCILLEPFFIDNDEELGNVDIGKLARGIVDGLYIS